MEGTTTRKLSNMSGQEIPLGKKVKIVSEYKDVCGNYVYDVRWKDINILSVPQYKVTKKGDDYNL